MSDIEIITNILCSYTGLPEYHIDKLNCNRYKNKQPYHIYFDNGIHFKFLVSPNEDFITLVESIYKRYLDESHELGMGCK